MSKLAILGDIHMGSSLNLGSTDPKTQLNSRLLDFVNTFNTIIDDFEKHKVETIIVTGDVFDTRNPSPSVVSAFSKCLKRATDKGFEIVMIAGNHDQLRTVDTTTIDLFDHLRIDNVSVFSKVGVKSFEDFHLVLIPYCDRKMLQVDSNDEASTIIRNNIIELTKDLKGPKIVVGHLMVGSSVSGLSGDNFSINEIVLPTTVFDGFDAVFMGHVHSAELIQKKNPVIAYVGSMEKINFGDKDQKKGTIIVDTQDIENFTIIPTSVRELFELSFDYSTAKQPLKSGITDKIVSDIVDYTAANDIEDSIVRLICKMKDVDVYHVNQERIKDKIMEYKVSCLSSIQIVTSTSRQLRDETITESEDTKKSFASFVNNLSESEQIKKKLLKTGLQIIEEVEGK